MKIASLKTHIVSVPPPHFGGMYWILVRVETACGIEGVGEIYATSFHPAANPEILQDKTGIYRGP